MKLLFYIAPSIINFPKANLIQSLCQFNSLQNHFNKAYYINISFLNKIKTKELISSCSPIESIPNGIMFSFLKIKRMNYIYNFCYQSYKIIYLYFKYFILTFYKELNYETYIYSRSIITSFFLSRIKNLNHIFEAHGKEKNKLLQKMQNSIIKNNNVKIVYISESLRRIYGDKSNSLAVLHDSSPYYKKKESNYFSLKNKYDPREDKRIKIVYSGSSGEGRGIDLIFALADLLKDYSFIILSDLDQRKLPDNIYNLGYQKHFDVLKILKETDFALMPYQDNLKIGNQNINSLEWMSPLKMFDYMNTRTAIITSYFPVLEEVIKDLDTGYFVYDYSNPEAWAKVLLNEIKNENKRYKTIAEKAKILFDKNYTYQLRSKKIINLYESF